MFPYPIKTFMEAQSSLLWPYQQIILFKLGYGNSSSLDPTYDSLEALQGTQLLKDQISITWHALIGIFFYKSKTSLSKCHHFSGFFMKTKTLYYIM